jgi:cytochrome oxidase Cu insertion factor (SCO1/SenC/PrrC family)
VWLPKDAEYGYDVRVQPRLNRMLTSSFTGWNNYMMDFGKLLADPEAMKHFGQTMVLWDFHARKPIQTLQVPGAPLEIRWALQPRHNYAFTSTALTSKIWLIAQQPDGTFAAKAVADIGDPTKTPLPVDLSLSADDRWLFVTTFMDGTVHVFDVAHHEHPKEVAAEPVAAQAGMMWERWDGARAYVTSSLLANWDKKGADGDQFLKAYRWDGTEPDAALRRRLPRAAQLGAPTSCTSGRIASTRTRIYWPPTRAPHARARRDPRTAALALLVVLVRATLAADATGEKPPVRPEDLAYVYGVGAFAPEYAPPPPGSYRLPPIDDVADHPLVGSDGRRTSLYALTRGRIAVVAFVYTSCAEATGCPVSLGVLHHLDEVLAADPALRARVVLVSLSFDPGRDTPARLAAVRALHEPRTRWPSPPPRTTALAPLLADPGRVARLHTRCTLDRATAIAKVSCSMRTTVRATSSAGFIYPSSSQRHRTVLPTCRASRSSPPGCLGTTGRR